MTAAPWPTGDDEYVHPLPAGEGAGWRESYYFGFYDEAADIGGFESFGYRVAKGHSGSMMVVWRPGDVAARLELGGALDNPARYEVGGTIASCVEPLRRWDLVYKGVLPRQVGVPMRWSVDDLKASSHARPSEVLLEAEFSADGEVGAYAPRPSYRHIFSGCYEQVGRLTGSLAVGEERYDLNCPAVRHHAWGSRDWFADREWNWCTAVLGDGTAAGFWYRSRDEGSPGEVNGWMRLDGETRPVELVEREISTEPAATKPLPRHARYALRDDRGRSLELVASVRQIIPAFFRPPDGRALLHWNDRSLVTFDSDRGSGHGEVEFIEVLEV